MKQDKNIITLQFPNCDVALLGGSVARGEATKTSDLDIVIVDQSLTCYRESFYSNGWPVEVFVHNFETYKTKMDCDRGRPSLPQLVSEGIALKGTGNCWEIKKKRMIYYIKDQLNGPKKRSRSDIFITDTLDDFIGATKREEELFIANLLADLVHEYVLRVNGKWLGSSKWFIRVLKRYDEQYANKFVVRFDHFIKRERNELIHFIEKTLEQYGGRVFEGFSIGK